MIASTLYKSQKASSDSSRLKQKVTSARCGNEQYSKEDLTNKAPETDVTITIQKCLKRQYNPKNSSA